MFIFLGAQYGSTIMIGTKLADFEDKSIVFSACCVWYATAAVLQVILVKIVSSKSTNGFTEKKTK